MIACGSRSISLFKSIFGGFLLSGLTCRGNSDELSILITESTSLKDLTRDSSKTRSCQSASVILGEIVSVELKFSQSILNACYIFRIIQDILLETT